MQPTRMLTDPSLIQYRMITCVRTTSKRCSGISAYRSKWRHSDAIMKRPSGLPLAVKGGHRVDLSIGQPTETIGAYRDHAGLETLLYRDREQQTKTALISAMVAAFANKAGLEAEGHSSAGGDGEKKAACP